MLKTRDTYYILIIFVLSCLYFYTTKFIGKIAVDINSVENILTQFKLYKKSIDDSNFLIENLFKDLIKNINSISDLNGMLLTDSLLSNKKLSIELGNLIQEYNNYTTELLNLLESFNAFNMNLNDDKEILVKFYNNLADLTKKSKNTNLSSLEQLKININNIVMARNTNGGLLVKRN